ncbi:MAG: hypothetical protein C0467_18510 [Planctomycetaceae bacterium]|nr:hypothetical protein [Planctomycetaceae bacterium]
MLVLTRRAGESIVIGNGIKITVVNIGPGRVKIGVEAPPSVRVDRSEIHDRILHEQATDVLAAVSAHTNSGDQPTIITGSETHVLPNRVAEQLPELPQPVAVTTPAPATGAGSVNRLSQYRAPRKPR